MLVILGAISFLSCFFFSIFYLRNFHKWMDEEFDSKYGEVLHGLKKDKKEYLFYPIFFIFRRILFILIILLIPNVPARIFILMLTSLFQLMYLLNVRPFSVRKLQYFENFNETVLLLQCYVILTFAYTNNEPDSEFRKRQDFLFIEICSVYLLVHLSNLFLSIFYDIRSACKKCYANRNGKKDGKVDE